MYNIIRTGRVFKGKIYAFGSKKAMVSDSQGTSITTSETSTDQVGDEQKAFLQAYRRNYVPDKTRVRLVEVLRNSETLRQAGVPLDGVAKKRTYLAAFVSGRAYPPEKASDVRGRRKNGGLSMYFPQLRGSHIGGKLLRTAAESCFGKQVMPNAENGTSYCDGLILLGYPGLKASRNRCGLYVCRAVLRIVLELLSLESASCSDLRNSTVEVDIFTDSNYVWDLLHNATSLLRWGSYSRKDDFVYDGRIAEFKANPDILYPLSRTYFRSVNQVFASSGDGAIGSQRSSVTKELHIRFRHKSELAYSGGEESCPSRSMDVQAARAAEWQYEMDQKPWV
jgi:hypothetical protein